MEVKNASGVKLSRSQKKRARSKQKKKERMEREIQNGNAESKEEEGTCLEAENVRSDLGAEQSIRPRKKRKKVNGNNSLIDEKKTDSFLKDEANSLTSTLGNSGPEPGPKEGPAGSETKRKRKKMNGNNSLVDEKKTDSFLKEEANSLANTFGNSGSEPGPKEGPVGSEKKRKKKKMAQMNAESVLELKDKQENPLTDGNKVSDSHLKISNNLGILENLPGLEGTQLNESETKRKRKKRKRNKTKLGAIEGEDISSKSNVEDNNEAGNKNMCVTQIIAGKDLRKEDLISISEAVESKHTNSTATESDLKGRKRKKSNEPLVQRNCISRPTPKKKLLILDLNGILVDVVQGTKKLKLKPHTIVNGKGVFKRPFCDEFLDFCFRTFDVGIWSSRLPNNVNSVVNCLMGKKSKRKLLFCWSRKMCTITKFKTLENKEKPLVLKELKKIWDKRIPGLPWKKGKYNESNTLLLDDSPYKALRNPANTAIFPYIYQYTDAKDCSLASKGDIRKYLERLAAAENVQKFIEQNPFGQPAITEADPHWDFYSQI